MASTLLRGHFYTILPYRPTLNPDEPENQSGTARATFHETSAFALHCPRAASHKWCLCRVAGRMEGLRNAHAALDIQESGVRSKSFEAIIHLKIHQVLTTLSKGFLQPLKCF